jgi:pantoate--beta-alanine ligase
METVATAAELRARLAPWRARGERVGFVPTMGALHAGHLALVRRARELAGRVVASVFVNPTQFGPGEDFARYPRDPAGDAALLAEAGCDLLFLPAVETVYPPGDATAVVVAGPALGLEGDHRPGHFRGVATVVARLFNLVGADLAVFGEKDAQQLAVVRRLVADLHFPVEIVAHPTAREPDGLALSSRNAFLDPEERRAATVLSRALAAGREAIAAGERRAEAVRAAMRAVLAAEPRARVDYAEVVDAETFRPVDVVAGPVVLPLAVRIGATRLIDNVQLTTPDLRGMP